VPPTAPDAPIRTDPVDLGVARECEDFLAGEIGDHSGSVWTWLNVIAHGDEERVRTIAAAGDGDLRACTQRSLARAVLASGRPIGSLQTAVLVPLELDIVGVVMTPRRLIELVGRAVFDVR
jgi:hypothetical protein